MALEAKINAILPPRYQHCYDSVSPTSMGSAELKFRPDGQVAWDEIWTTFCDLALAGGPPHRGTLLMPAPPAEIAAQPIEYQHVVEEIGRGIWMVTGLHVLPHVAPGWVGVICRSDAMAAWLVRAIVAENVMARHQRHTLYLPAGPAFRLAKEIKNVVTVLAKTCHYWSGHMSASQQAAMTLPEPAAAGDLAAFPAEHRPLLDDLERAIRHAMALPTVPSQISGWLGVQCVDVAMAVWLLRAVVVDNVLARREERVLYVRVPSDLGVERQAARFVESLARARRLWDVHAATRRS